ncbi:IPT/TIG domain-containing protein [Heliobacterium mobile]|nr:IPT/TIG domain-containing protein [Heliobacterium mobile]
MKLLKRKVSTLVQKTVAILLTIALTLTIIPLKPSWAAATVTKITYAAQDAPANGSSVTLSLTIVGTGVSTANASNIYFKYGNTTIPFTKTGGSSAGSGTDFITGNIVMKSEYNIPSNSYLTLFFDGNLYENGFLYRARTTRELSVDKTYVRNDVSTQVTLSSSGFFDDGDNWAGTIVKERVINFGGLLTFPVVQSAPAGQETNYAVKAAGSEKISFWTPTAGQGLYDITMRRAMEFPSPAGAFINRIEEDTVYKGFGLTGDYSQPPVLTKIEAKPLANLDPDSDPPGDRPGDLSLQYRTSAVQDLQDYIRVYVWFTDIASKLTDPSIHYDLVIKNSINRIYKDTNGLYYADVPRTIAQSKENAQAFVARSDYINSLGYSVTLWADPYHRYNGSNIQINKPVIGGVVYLKKGDTSTLEIADTNVPGNFNINNLSDPTSIISNDELQIRVGNKENGTWLKPENQAVNVTSPGANKITFSLQANVDVNPGEETPIWIFSKYGYSKIDSKIVFLSQQDSPSIALTDGVKVDAYNGQSVSSYTVHATYPQRESGLERTVPRDADKVDVILTGVNYIQGVTWVKIGDIIIPKEDIKVNQPIIGKLTLTIPKSKMPAQPGDVPITVYNGPDPATAPKYEETVSRDKNSFNTVTNGFRFLSVPDFPTLPHKPETEKWPERIIDNTRSDYYTLLNQFVETPTPKLDWRGNQIIKLKNGQDFYRVFFKGTDPASDPDKWITPKVTVKLKNGNLAPYTATTLETYTPDPVSGEVSFRMPDLSQSGFPDPATSTLNPYRVDVEIENPDGQKIVLPEALDIVNRSSTKPTVDTFIPDQVPNVTGHDVLVNGSNFAESVNNPPKVYMGFWPTDTTFTDSQHVMFKTYQQDFLEPLIQYIDVPVTVVNPDGTASDPKKIRVIKNTPNAPSISDVVPKFGPAQSNAKPIIFVKGSNFKTQGRLLTQIYIDEVPATLPNQYTDNLISFELPYITAPRQNMHIILRFSDDSVAWSPFNTYLTNPMTVNAVVPDSGPALQTSGQTQPTMADVTITGSGFGTSPEVYVGGVKVTQFNATPTDTTLMFRVPPLPAGTYKITIVDPVGKSIGSTPNDFTYLDTSSATSPTVTSVNVYEGKTNKPVPPQPLSSGGGQQVTVVGNLFMMPNTTNPPNPRVFIAGKEIPSSAFIETPTTTRLVFTTQPTDPSFFSANETSKTVDLQVMRSDGAIAAWKVTIARSTPVIDSISPCGADIDDSPRPKIYIAGTDLQSGMTVRFGDDIPGKEKPGEGPNDVTATRIGDKPGSSTEGIKLITYNRDTKKGVYLVTVPDLTNLYDKNDMTKNWIRIRVYNPDGQVAEKNGFYFRIYQDEQGPTITSIDPDRHSAKGGTYATITLTNLNIDYTDKKQWPYFVFGGIRVMPNDSTGINYPPDPNQNLTNEPVVLKKAPDSPDGEWVFDVRVPAFPWPTEGAYKDAEEYPNVEVLAVNRNNCTATKDTGVGHITYTRPHGDIVITNIDPTTGTTDGGTEVTLTAAIIPETPTTEGSNGFSTKNGMPRVFFGSVEGTVTDVSEDGKTLKVTTPPHEIGSVQVIVINPNNAQGTAPKPFVFADIPVIDSIKPASGPYAGNIAAVIKGRGFTADKVTVTFTVGSASATATVKKATETEIQIIVPQSPATIPDGDIKVKADISVTNSDGSKGTKKEAFTYYKDDGQPVESPQVTVKVLNKNAIRLSWDPVNMAKAYEVQVSEGDRGNYRLDQVVDAGQTQNGKVYVIVKGLEANSQYWFRVRAISSAGLGPYSEDISAETNNKDGFDGFEQPDNQIVTDPEGAKLILRKGTIEKYYDLRKDALGASATKQVSFSPDVQGFNNPVLLDNGNWKVVIPPTSLKYNAGNMIESYATVRVAPAPGQAKEQVLLANRNRQPLSEVYEFTLNYNDGKQSFTPADYGQPFTLTVNYRSPGLNRGAAMYYYNWRTGQWQRLNSYTDPVAVSANIEHAGYYTVFPE